MLGLRTRTLPSVKAVVQAELADLLGVASAEQAENTVEFLGIQVVETADQNPNSEGESKRDQLLAC